jgi:hypothetical protein
MSCIADPPYANEWATTRSLSVALGNFANNVGRIDSFQARSISSSWVRTEYAPQFLQTNAIIIKLRMIRLLVKSREIIRHIRKNKSSTSDLVSFFLQR